MVDYALMNSYLYMGKDKPVKEMTEQALEEGRPVDEILQQGLIYGMSVVGEDFKQERLYVPEVLMAARAMKAGVAILKPLLAECKTSSSAGVIVMGTVQGDLHDIGKNLVCLMAEGAGFEVHDLGTDVNASTYINALKEHKGSLVGRIALLTTTMTYMAKVIGAFEQEGMDDIKTCIGGAPVSQMFADEIGADGYGADAASAVDLFKDLIGSGVAKA